MEKEILIPRDVIQRRVEALAREISDDYQGADLVMVGVLKGAIFFFADLLRALRIPASIDFVRAASYGSGTQTSGEVRVTKDVELPLQGRSVLLVEDIVDTGITLAHLIDIMRAKQARSVRVCALIEKLERKRMAFPIDYCGFRFEEGFLVGYGLDFNEQFRGLPDIYVLKE